MFRRLRRYCLPVLAAAGLAVAASGRRAEASCGDYLYGHAQRSDVPTSSGEASRDPSTTGPVHAPDSHRGRCHGPFCNGDSHQPVPPAPGPRIPVQRDYGALHCAAGFSGGTGIRGRLTGPPAFALRGFPDAIEHPPRG